MRHRIGREHGIDVLSGETGIVESFLDGTCRQLLDAQALDLRSLQEIAEARAADPGNCNALA